MIITTVRERSDICSRQSVDIKKHVINEIDYLVDLLDTRTTIAMADKGKQQVHDIRNTLQSCILAIESLKA
jgi:hypothetical protein